MPETTCPSCGAPFKYDEDYAQLVVCPYCNNSIAVVDKSLKVDQKLAPLTKVPTRLEIGKTLVHNNVEYAIMGVARYEYGDGFWDEWHLLNTSNNQVAFYTEDEGDYILFHEKKILPAAEAPSAPIGQTFSLGEQTISLREKGQAKLSGMMGQIANQFPPMTPFTYVDGVIGQHMVIVSYLQDRVILATGTPVRYTDVTIK